MDGTSGMTGGDRFIGDWLQSTDPGSAFSHRFTVSGEGVATVFMIHEDADHVAALPAQVMIRTRIGLFVEDGVGVLAIVMRIQDEVYETWLNRHLPGGVEESFEDLATQETLYFHFYVDGPRPERTIWIPNMDRETFARILEALDDLEPWSMQDFDRARARVEARYSSVRALWNALGDGS